MSEPAGLWSGDGAALPLGGVRVVDFGQFVAGPLTALLLAEQGADVIRIDPPGGPRWDDDANSVLLRGRRHVVFDLDDPHDRARAARLVASADVVVENFRPGVMARLGVGPAASLSRNPRLVYCSLPGFGESDPRCAVPGWEGVVMAAAGAYSAELPTSLLAGDDSGGGIAFSALPLASTFAAMEAALSITAALVARERDGLGQWVEVPLFDALAEAVGVRALSYERPGPPMVDYGHGIFRCQDGSYVSLIMVQFRHVQWAMSAFGIASDDIPHDPGEFHASPTAAAALRGALADTFANKPAEHWEREGRRIGLPIARMRTTAEWLREPVAVESGAVVTVDDPVVGEMRAPGPAVTLSEARIEPLPSRRTGGTDSSQVKAAIDGWAGEPAGDDADLMCTARSAAPLEGLRVIDMSRVVAGPTAAKLLAQLGADVLMIDSDPDTRVSALQEPVFHDSLNRGKRSAIVDLTTPAGRSIFDRLIDSADVVVQNSTADAIGRLGVTPEALRTRQEQVTVISLNTYGRSGPWAGDRGYAEIANIVTGVAARTAPDPIPTGASPLIDRPRWPFTDYAAGLLAAFGAVVSLHHRRRGGPAHVVEATLVRAAAIEEIVYAYGHDGRTWDEPTGADAVGWSTWNRLYETNDGWIFAAVPDDARDRVLRAIAADDVDPGSSGAASRVAGALLSMPSEDAVSALLAAGAGAHRVCTIEDLLRPGGPWDRRGIRLEDVSPDRGRVVMVGPVARLHRTPLRPGRLPEPFGAATRVTADGGWPHADNQ